MTFHLPKNMSPTPPSPRMRRQELRESQETEGEMSIEEYLSRSDPYMSTTISDPLPHPLHVGAPDPTIEAQITQYMPMIQQIVREYFEKFSLSLRTVTKPGYPGGDRPIQVMFVYVRAEIDKGFDPLKYRLWSFLVMNNIQHQVDIQVVDKLKNFQPSLFPIEPNHPDVASYNRAERALLTTLRYKLTKTWRLLSLFYIGLTQEESVPAVVVYVSPRTTCDWFNLYYRLVCCLKSVGARELRVEFLPGGCFELMPSSMPGTSYDRRMGPDVLPQMDTSIGVEDEEGASTLGGFINLQWGERVHMGILTSYNALQPGWTIARKRYETSYFGSQNDKLRTDIHYLAVKDAKRTVEQAKIDLEIAKNLVTDYQKESDERKLIGMRPHLGNERLLELNKAKIVQLEKMIGKFEAMPIALGKVLVSSGRTASDDKKILDWAFVELAGPKAQQHFIQNVVPTIESRNGPKAFLGDRVGSAPDAGFPIIDFGKIEPGKWYYKSGRTTEVTGGVCNGVAAHCTWPGSDAPRYDKHGNAIQTPGPAETKEYVVLSKREHTTQHSQTHFCRPGDSGAWVINETAQLCGLLFGEITGYCGPDSDDGSVYVGAGIVSCISDVRKSVEYKTTPTAFGKPTGEGGYLSFE